MSARKADAVWTGTLREGEGNVKLGSGTFEGKYSFKTRFEDAPGTNPEELIAAAHSSCYSMALNAGLERAGFPPKRVHTTASVSLGKVNDAFAITRIELETEAEVPGIDEAAFQEQAKAAKENCPISKALAGVGTITLSAKLV
jgi:osmotically inducible protein OsmC